LPLRIFYKNPGPRFWEETFQGKEIEYNRSPDEYLESVIRRMLCREMRILDAGCGLGELVNYLSLQGFEAYRLDFSKILIHRAKEKLKIEVLVGDLRSIPFTENSFDVYISLGVLEHFEDGVHVPLKEANQVLRIGGLLIVSVPYWNVLRKLKKLFLRKYHYVGRPGKDFFEYAFSKREMIILMRQHGFNVIEIIPTSPSKTLELDVPGIAKILKKIALSKLIKDENKVHLSKNGAESPSFNAFVESLGKIIRSKFLREILGHMILVIAKKSENLKELYTSFSLGSRN